MIVSKIQEQPLVSVCIPVFNHELYVQECIQSVIDQDYDNIELIIIDDGSTDNSVKNIEPMLSLCEKRFKRFKFISRENKGVSYTMNEALAWGNGVYFSGCASDDIMLDCKISTLVKHLENNASCAGVFGGLKIFINNPNIISGYVKPKNRSYSFNDLFLLKATLPGPGMLLRLKSVNEVGGYNLKTKVEDWDLWLRLTNKGYRLDTIRDYVSLYRRHEHNTSGNFTLMHIEMAAIVDKYKKHVLYHHAKNKLNCIKFRDFAVSNKKMAIKMLPSSIFFIRDIRFYQGLYNLLFKW